MTPTLTTGRLTLVPFSVEMISARYISWLNDPDVVRYSEQRHKEHTEKTCEAYVRSIDHEVAHMWAVANSMHIGNITAHRDRPNMTADIGILIGEKSEWGKGYGAEAWIAVCEWLLSDGVRLVTAGAMVENLSMMRIFQKSGMSIDGRRPDRFLLDGTPVDEVLVSKAAPTL